MKPTSQKPPPPDYPKLAQNKEDKRKESVRRHRCHSELFVTVNVNSHNDGSNQSQEQHVGPEEDKQSCFKTAFKAIAKACK